MAVAPTASSIEVTVRVRPIRPELRETNSAWSISPSSLSELAQPDNSFSFDRVYSIASTTSDIYQKSIREQIVKKVAQGYNGTVFAYGQTGSGKSYTMFGAADPRASGGQGVVAMAAQDLFQCLKEEKQRRPYVQQEVFVSVIEIYNEQLRDLLGANGGEVGLERQGADPLHRPPRGPAKAGAPVLSIREDVHGVYVHNALRQRVSTAQECVSAIYRSAASRVSGATAMNEHSSRSHCVIRVTVERSMYLEDMATDDEDRESTSGSSDDDEDQMSRSTASSSVADAEKNHHAKHKKRVVSSLNLVDLAGSERVAKTGATGLRMVEGGHINKSLTTLTTVINRLTSGGGEGGGGAGSASPSSPLGGQFIPYRDSRLTHLLKTAIGGNSFTSVLCCITPSVENVNESRSTLQFASRAKRIHNRVRVNEVANPSTRVRELETALRRVKKLMVAQTLYLWSKQLRLGHCQEQLAALQSVGAAVSGAGGLPGGRNAAVPLAGNAQQQALIIAQLTSENEGLREEVERLRRSAASGSAAEGSDSSSNLRLLERQLQQKSEEAKQAIASLGELDNMCRELENENKKQTETIRTLTAQNKEAEQLLDAVDSEQEAAQQEITLLRSQLQATQSKLTEKGRGDAYLAELTKVHIDHQNLQYSLCQLQEKSAKEQRESLAKLEAAVQAQHDMEDDLDEVKERCGVLNSYLWRLVSAVEHVTQGKPLQMPDGSRPIQDTQVTDAIKRLTTSSASGGTKVSPSRAGERGADGGEGSQIYQERIRELEEQLATKDSQRDVIVDTKLKRIQELVLRLHTTNQALMKEMRVCYSENEALFEIAVKYPKTAQKVIKLGLQPRSFHNAVDRAQFTQVPEKPLYHN